MKTLIKNTIMAKCLIVLTACSGDMQTQEKAEIPNTHVAVSTEANPSIEDVDYSQSYVKRLHQTRIYPSQFEIGNSQLPKVNKEALVTAMCYTKHDAKYNPCYTCHQDAVKGEERANKMDDGFLQKKYIFSAYAMKNNWSNLFVDRSSEVSKISDEEIDTYVTQDNYTALAPMLKSKGFIGYVPDIENFHLGPDAFESDGFAKDGSGWVAFNYKPLPSTFWPVNGSTDDVLIRLDNDFRENSSGEYSKTVYQFNLAITEAAVKGLSTISVNELDERSVGVDLNGDGVLGVVSSIIRPEFYVGKASYMPVETFLYPLYTEFLHSVRYVGSDQAGNIYNAPRMKELRYMVKTKSYADERVPYTKAVLAGMYDDEWQEKWEGNNAPFFGSLQEKGIDNKMGWRLQGFIEDADGELRPQTYEETFYCMGCHTNLGSTFDQVFSFARKVDGKEGWGYIDLKSMLDVPNKGEEEGEILTYLKRVGGGSEFRTENDIHTRFYDNGELNVNKVKRAASVYDLITPSRKRALVMNKGYRVLVQSQDFLHGREGNPKPVQNVYREIDESTPLLPVEKFYKWDMRLDWSKN
jgi:hypothetical protein